MKIETLKKYIGNTYGVITVLGLDHEEYDKIKQIKNCVPCCFICNRMKNKYNLNIFLDKVKDIYNNFYNKSSTTISKESTSEAIADGKGESLNTKVKENDIV